MGLLSWLADPLNYSLSWLLPQGEHQPAPFGPANPTRFSSFDERAAAFLKSEGYVVRCHCEVISVLDEEKVLQARSLLWDFWEQLDSGMKRDDDFTWGLMDKYIHTNTGIINSFGIGQSQLLWFLRSQPAVKASFAGVWNDDDLISSFDGAGVFRPWATNKAWRTNGGWYHVDQSPKRQGLSCVQGLLTLFDQDMSTGTAHEAMLSAVTVFLRQGLEAKLVDCRAGDLVLWDSRTVHCNNPAPEGHGGSACNESTQLLRAVAYVCMVPRSWASEDALERRKKCFGEQETSTHWPHEPNIPSSWKPLNSNFFKLSKEQLAIV